VLHHSAPVAPRTNVASFFRSLIKARQTPNRAGMGTGADRRTGGAQGQMDPSTYHRGALEFTWGSYFDQRRWTLCAVQISTRYQPADTRDVIGLHCRTTKSWKALCRCEVRVWISVCNQSRRRSRQDWSNPNESPRSILAVTANGGYVKNCSAGGQRSDPKGRNENGKSRKQKVRTHTVSVRCSGWPAILRRSLPCRGK